jgi:hypothetical protein
VGGAGVRCVCWVWGWGVGVWGIPLGAWGALHIYTYLYVGVVVACNCVRVQPAAASLRAVAAGRRLCACAFPFFWRPLLRCAFFLAMPAPARCCMLRASQRASALAPPRRSLSFSHYI